METQAKRLTAIRLTVEQIDRVNQCAQRERRQFADMLRILIDDGLQLRAKVAKKGK